MAQEREVKIEVVSEFAKPSAHPVAGDRRLVRHLPLPLPGLQGQVFPAIWISPYVVFDAGLKENVKICIVLLGKGPPAPEIVSIRMSPDGIEKFPMMPVEW